MDLKFSPVSSNLRIDLSIVPLNILPLNACNSISKFFKWNDKRLLAVIKVSG